MSEAKLLPSGDERSAQVNKPRMSLAEYEWRMAFERVKALPAGTKLGDYELDFVLDDPHPLSVWLKYRADKKLQRKGIRLGDPLLIELASHI